jgi:hypothetical protein
MSILDRDLDECQTFEEISEWRLEKYKIDRKSGDDYTGILTNIYKEPTHFIYELLQNADDAKATSVKFSLSQDKIEFYHDGSKEFSLGDIISITGVGNSSKDAKDTTSIGKFGVGFKAVFAVTNKPLIYSTTYNFQIENLSVPLQVPHRDLGGFTTIFQLDFKHEGRDALFRRNEALLRSMTPETILFLKNICKVDISIEHESLPAISVNRIEAQQSYRKIKYRLGDKNIELLKFTSDGCSVVYQIEDGTITPITGSKISVFFPTIIDSNLSFLVDAPFQTSTTRESIDFELPHNVAIVKKFSGLFSDSIRKLKSLNLFTVETFNEIMPINPVDESEDFPIYKELYAAFLNDITSKSFVPTSRGTLLPATKICIADDPEIPTLLQSVDGLHFAHPNLSAVAVAFIGNAGAKEFESYNLLGLINKNEINLTSKSEEWLYKLYEYCLKSIANDGWSRMFTRTVKHTPLIKTRSGSFTSAYFNDNPSVFRPSKGIPDHRTIHPMFLTESSTVSDATKGKMKTFLNELGITERKPVIVLKEDYFKNYFEKTSDEKIEIFIAAANIYSQSEPKDKPDIIAYLKDVAFIPSETNEFKLASSLYDAYNPDLKFLLFNKHPELFCSQLITNNAVYRDFSLELGMIDSLKVDAVIDKRTNRDDFVELYHLVGSNQDYGTSTKEFIRRDYESHPLAIIFKDELSPDLTARLVPLLQHIRPEQFKETFEWTYHGTKKEVIGPSAFGKLLAETRWIAKDDQMLRPIDISFDAFCELYKLPRDNVLQNLEWSNDDIIKQLSEKDQELLKLAREIDPTPEELFEFRQSLIDKRKKSEGISKRQSAPINQVSEQPEYSELEEPAQYTNNEAVLPVDRPAEADQHEDINELHASADYEAADTEPELNITARTAVKSGWSNVEREEREVLRSLVDQYKGDHYSTEQESDDIASYTMNKDGKTVKLLLLPKNSSGYNIEISEDDKIVKTVAVIKTDLDKKRFVISEAQWNLLKRSDVQHSIYLVSRHGETMNQVVIDDLRERIRDGSARAVPGVIYF